MEQAFLEHAQMRKWIGAKRDFFAKRPAGARKMVRVRALGKAEGLGKLALNTRSRDNAERGQLLHIARKLAQEMQCQVEVEDLSDEYTVWLFGSRRQIGAIMRELAARG